VKIRFQADASLDPDIGRGLARKNPAIDWQPAKGVIADGTPDPEVLQLAARDGRVLLTLDVATMICHFIAFTATQPSPGILLIPTKLRMGAAIDRLDLFWQSWTAEDMENQVRWLDR
jgi:predicted nuclease of predicted toxin-antitoxin system